MRFDPEKHHRRSIRLKDYDYCQSGLYFVTICTADRKCTLGTVGEGNVELSQAGRIVEQCWLNLPKHFPNIELDSFGVMPNHMHGIIILINDERRGDAFANQTCCRKSNLAANASPPTPQDARPHGTPAGSLGAVIRTFKSITSRRMNQLKCAPHPLWKRDYYEHIIRNDKSLDEIREYIQANPWNWQDDDYYVA